MQRRSEPPWRLWDSVSIKMLLLPPDGCISITAGLPLPLSRLRSPFFQTSSGLHKCARGSKRESDSIAPATFLNALLFTDSPNNSLVVTLQRKNVLDLSFCLRRLTDDRVPFPQGGGGVYFSKVPSLDFHH